MGFAFEKFTEIDASFCARISVRRTGQFGFNSGAVNRYGIDSFDFCVLYYDRTKKAVGLELRRERCEGAIEIKRNPSNVHVRAKNFCDRFDIDYAKSRTYKLEKDDETGLLYFILDEADQEFEPENQE